MASRVTRRNLLGSFLALTAGAELLQPQNSRSGPLVDAWYQATQQANRQFLDALKRGDAPGCAAVYAEDAKLMPPHSPMRMGRKAIEEFWDGAIKSGIKAGTLTVLELQDVKKWLIEIGTYTLDVQPVGKSPQTDEGNYVVLWKRHSRAWKISVDIFNSNLPAA